MTYTTTLHLIILATTWVIVIVASLITYYRLLGMIATGMVWVALVLQMVANHLVSFTVIPPAWAWLWDIAPWLPYAQMAALLTVVILLLRAGMCPRGRCGHPP